MTAENPFDKTQASDDFLIHCAAADGRVRYEVIHGNQNSFEAVELGHQLADEYGFSPMRQAEVFDLAKAELERAKSRG